MHRRVAAVLLALFALPSFAAITGTVMTPDGAPVAGARVSIHALETPEARRARLMSAEPQPVPLATTQTDARGNYSLESPKDPVVDLRIIAAGFDPLTRRIERDEEVGAIALIRSEMKSGVIRAGGKPVSGATVVLAYGGGEYIGKTDEQGKYDAPDPKRASSILVLHPGFAIEQEVFLSSATASALNRTLSTGTTITGRVVAADGTTPVAKATVMVDSWPLATSGDDGTFTIARAPSKWNALTAQSGSLVAMRAHSSDKSFTLRLGKPGTFTGRVTDTKTKLPVAGALIRVGQRMGRMAPAEGIGGALTDAKGNFSVSVPPGTYFVTAFHPGYEMTPADVSVSAGQQQVRDISATPLARVTGMVMSDDRKPMAAAAVAAEEATESFPPRPMRMMRDSLTVSGPDGKFSMRVSGDTDLRVRASRKGLPVTKSEPFRVAAGERKSGIVIAIPNGIAVSGRVTDRDGTPLSGVAVTAAEAASGPRGMMVRNIVMVGGLQQAEEDAVRTGSDGTFTLRVKEGTYDFAFKREGFATRNVRGITIAPNNAEPVNATLDPAVEITGRVVRGGVGVDGVTINTFGEGGTGPSVTTGPDGSFTLSGLTPGEVRAFLRKETDFIQENRSLTAPGRDVVIELPAGTRVSGRVVDKATRKPVTSFQAGVANSRGGGGMMVVMPASLRAFTNDDGSFVLDNVPAGAVSVVANAPGYAQARMNLTIEEGKPLSDIELELDPGTKLVGKVTGPDGSALPGVTVRVAMFGSGGTVVLGGAMKNTVTDSNGEYVLEALEATDEDIEFSHPKYVGTRKTITPKGREVRLDVQLSSGQRVTGVVVTEGGAPVADAEVEAMAGAGTFRNARTDANGAFTFESLTPARYRFSASKRGYAEARVDDFDISSGAPVRLVMKSGAIIYGTVHGLSAEELSSATVEARGPEGFSNAPVDAQGNFRIEGAPVGTVRVAAVVSQIFSTRKSSQPETVTVGAGESRQVNLEFRSDVVVRGRVSRNGRALASAQVSFTPKRGSATQTLSSATTDSAGNYSVSGLEPGEYNVSVIDTQRFSPYSTTYEVRGSGTFDIEYTASALRGRVVDAATGDPISDARVQVRSTARDGGFRGDRGAATDVAGTFTVDFIPPGTYTVTADKAGYGNEVREVIVGESTPQELELKLSKNAGVTLKVVDGRDGRAINASADVYDHAGRLVQDSGGIRFGGVDSAADVQLSLAPGQYVATVMAPGYAAQNVNLVSPGTQTVALTPGGRIVVRASRSERQRIRLVDARGQAYPRSRFGQPGRDLPPSPATLPINNVAPGSYTIQVLTNNDTTVVRSVPVVVTEGGVVEVDV